ncbi:uncharacterized protein LOC110836708 isoform X2 [Zootermopsis nevadensis]|uniref:uncharacterized protein LOC110836708 isoform X2 n=1 Tax=Zootermopsis nevadensis TaxID=136037 RepID=UPI000B8E6D13|nr:uncharacterized protein LOC110836708 isoform X2 [Zootermopsis nevadensis]
MLRLSLTVTNRRSCILLVLLITLTRGYDVTAACWDSKDAVSMATRHATAIFTGKVNSLTHSDNGEVTAVITVKRVFKKINNVGVFENLNAGESVRVRIIRSRTSILNVKKYHHVGKFTEAAVDLRPILDDLNCSSSVTGDYSVFPGVNFVKKLRVKDTKIFLARKLEFRREGLLTSVREDPYMELDWPPLPLKLDILDRISAAVKGWTRHEDGRFAIILCDQFREGGLDARGTCSTHVRNEKYTQNIGREIRRGL